MDEGYKEVYFGEYCKTCEHETLAEDIDPCHDCLNNPVNVYSHKPVNYVQAERGHVEATKRKEKTNVRQSTRKR